MKFKDLNVGDTFMLMGVFKMTQAGDGEVVMHPVDSNRLEIHLVPDADDEDGVETQ